MGYTTEFSGKITITPPLNEAQIETINNWCEERHAGPVQPHAGCPGIWCDYKVSEEGDKIYWNGAEKAYYMDKWMEYLIEKYFIAWGKVLNGRMLAEGEDSEDVWVLEVKANDVNVIPVAPRPNLHITE